MVQYLRITIPSRIIVEIGNDDLNLFLALLLNIIMISIMAFTIYKSMNGRQVETNKYIVYYFTAYVWILFVPFTDFLSNIIMNSNPGNPSLLLTLQVLGYIGLIQTYV